MNITAKMNENSMIVDELPISEYIESAERLNFHRLIHDSIEAYNILAPEYDSLSHSTTRILENLSGILLSEYLSSLRLPKDSAILEVGAGTGALGNRIYPLLGVVRELVISDPAPEMLKVLKSRFRNSQNRHSISFRNLSASKELYGLKNRFNAIFCGLADPYFSIESLIMLKSACKEGGYLLVTLPEIKWSIIERLNRLNVPLYRTRFQLKSGDFVFPLSFTYNWRQISEMMEESGFRLLKCKTKILNISKYNCLQKSIRSNPPAVIGFIAVRNEVSR